MARGQFAGEHFVKDHAERIDVGAMVGCLGSRVLFRGHVVRRADSLLLVWRAVAPQHLGDAEVGDFHLAGLVEQQVFRLDVAVDDCMIVRVLQRVADWRHDGQGLFRLQPARAEELAQVHAVNILHQQVKQPVGLSEVVDRDNVRVTQFCERLGLASEAFGELRIFFPLGGEDLEGHEPVERFLPRLVNHPHAAAPQAGQDFELREMRRNLFQRRGL